MAKPFKFRGKWWIRFTDESGKRRKRVFDAFIDATHALTAEKARVREVKVGLRSPTPQDRLFGELCEYWLKHRAGHKRSGRHDESIIRANLRPFFGETSLRRIDVALVDRFVANLSRLNPKTIANILTLLISMLNLAVDLGWLLKAPRIKKPRIRLFSTDYRFLRTNEEIARFLRAAFLHDEFTGTLYTTAIYTGLRAGELAGLRWDKIDFARRLIVVDQSFDGPTKAGDVRYVPVLDPLLPVLRAWRLKVPGRLVFPNRLGTMHQPSARIFQETLHRVLDDAGFPTAAHGQKLRRYICFHDLRHTFASHWVSNGGDIFKLQKILGHKSTQMTQRYAHLAPAAFAGDHDLISDLLPREGRLVVLPDASTATSAL